MIWPLVKTVAFLLLVVAVAWATGLVMEVGDVVRLSFGGREYSMTSAMAVFSLFASLAGLWLLLLLFGLASAVLRFLSGDETAISRYFDRNRERRGFEALSRGMVALAVGEEREATAQAVRAERDLNRPQLTDLVNAQAAELSGDRGRAARYYKRLLGSRATRVIGIRGLMRQRLEDGDPETALRLAEKAQELRPNHEETLTTLLTLQLDQEEWAGARKTIQASAKAKRLPKAVARRREAVVMLADARKRLEAGDIVGAASAAREANRLAPALIPAAVLAAEMESDKGNTRRAESILRKAWSANPHPDLAAAFAGIRPDETPADRLKRFQPLLKLNPSFEETRLLGAELRLAADDVPGARRALGPLSEETPTVRSLAIMGAVARGEGASEHVVRGWLTRALNAPGGPRWTCENCSHVHTSWRPVCETCKAFDTLGWKPPPAVGENGDSVPVLGYVTGILTGGNRAERRSDADDAGNLDEVRPRDGGERPAGASDSVRMSVDD
ncbi:MAG: heme biosynthesis protein HemY [Paracoccaceae bacterium]|nr:heme biosynthesis protein HemY [Paracoccaceae bacterium]